MPMNGESLLLDTSIIVEHFRPPGKHSKAMEQHALYVPEIVVAELFAGAMRSHNPVRNRTIVDEFLESVTLVPSDLETATIYAHVWLRLAEKGKMIPHNDIWIASLALQHGHKLVTKDSHFQNVDGLEVENW